MNGTASDELTQTHFYKLAVRFALDEPVYVLVTSIIPDTLGVKLVRKCVSSLFEVCICVSSGKPAAANVSANKAHPEMLETKALG